MLSLFWVLLSMGGIILACEAFTNAIEWFGKKLNLSEGAVGSVLAAVGTALPETIIPIIAIAGAWFAKDAGGTHAGTDIGIGAIVGAPFMLGTLALFITGAAIVVFTRQGRRDEKVLADTKVMKRDLRFFLMTYPAIILASFIPSHAVKVALGFVLLGLYGYYVYKTLQEPGELGDNIAPLYFYRKGEPKLGVVVAQIIFSLLGIMIGAHFFVHEIGHLAHAFNISPLILSLVVTPIATELPEKFNSVMWVRVKKDTLALGNITGAMVFQSCIPVAVGLWLTPWELGRDSLFSAAIAVIAAAVLYWEVSRKKGITAFSLMLGGLFYAAFLIGVFVFKI
ncbi:sodium:calcium antiporter [bacterium]|nr:sodium:calcium antiporter [bacterium]